MSLERLEIRGIRNIGLINLDLDSNLNLLVGHNGSGKTSILESIFLLGSGRSFRTASIESLVGRSGNGALVRGQTFRGDSLAVERTREGGRNLRLGGEVVRRTSQLAEVLPVQVLRPETINLILGSPAERRRFLNWGMFHVEPAFWSTWQAVNRCLQQRNKLLKDRKTSDEEFASWTSELVRMSEQLDQYRQQHMSMLEERFRLLSAELHEIEEIDCRYRRGWAREEPLSEGYARDQQIDEEKGYTQRGFHRADVKITVHGQDAASVCSRGELKLLAWTLTIAQSQILNKDSGLVYLVDDLLSELDSDHRNRFAKCLLSTGWQILATGTDVNPLTECWKGVNGKLFHVEHGTLNAEERLNV